jgi:hypothetical protein
MVDDRAQLLTTLVLAAFLASGLAAIGSSDEASGHGTGTAFAGSPFHSPDRGTTTGMSSNWAGYVIQSAAGRVSVVQASWKVPQVAAPCPSSARYSAFWIGIDGDGSSTVEQIGTATDCSSGSASYYAWYEFYPGPLHKIPMTISPTNNMHAEVNYSTITKLFTLSLTDLTTGSASAVSSRMSTAKRASAEWIAEAPSSGAKVLPLTDFGWVTFSNASATISGHTHSIRGFTNVALTMWNIAGTTVMASPAALLSSGTEFVVTWKSKGP